MSDVALTEAEAPRAPWPGFEVIEGDSQPLSLPQREPWVWSPKGILLPRTGKHRIRLCRQRVTKEWRQLGRDLDAATDAIARAPRHEVDLALKAWRAVAWKAMRSRFVTPHAMRDRIALASILAGEPFDRMMHPSETLLQDIFSALYVAAYFAALGGTL